MTRHILFIRLYWKCWKVNNKAGWWLHDDCMMIVWRLSADIHHRDDECQLDQPRTVKNASLYLAAPGSNPGARILRIMLPQLRELCTSDTYPTSNCAMLLAWRWAAMWIEHFRTRWLEGGRGSRLQRKIFCINYMTFTGPVYLGSQDQTLQRRARVHDVFYSICNGRRKVFCIECYTRKYGRIRRSCQVQPLQQRDAHKFLTVGGTYSA